jgi:diadenylate cyclase
MLFISMSEKIVSTAKEKSRERIIDFLKLVSPGTVLRTAIDDISRAGMGGFIVLDAGEIKNITEGGFRVNTELSAQRIVELSKMDGAIILSSDLSKILHANVLLFPDVNIPTNETGTRHRAAERTAKQAGTLTIAISERKKTINLYHGNLKYILKNPEELLSRATETLQILEKQREILNELLSNLNVLEISGLVVLNDVCSVLQRIEIIMRTAKTIERYLVELGREGVIIRMRLRELLKNVVKERELILEDYGAKKENNLDEFSFDDLLDIENISQLLFSSPSEDKIQAKGHRILSKMNLDIKQMEKLIASFGSLSNILIADDKKLARVLGDETENFKKEISSLKEQIMMAKKI